MCVYVIAGDHKYPYRMTLSVHLILYKRNGFETILFLKHILYIIRKVLQTFYCSSSMFIFIIVYD